MASIKVPKHTRIVRGKRVEVAASSRVVKASRVVGKPGPKINAPEIRSHKPRESKYTIEVSADLYNRVRVLCDERDVTLESLISVALRGIESNQGRHYDLDTPMGFGKYAAETFGAVIRLDPNYIRWILGQQKGVTLSNRAQSLFNVWAEGK